jgi:hypothetical protein
MSLQTSESTGAIVPAFVRAQKNMGIAGKNSTNTDFASTYADLAAVRAVTLPALLEEGISVLQFPSCRDSRVHLTTRLWHESGEWIESTCDTRLPRDDAQALGSAITYLRRYCLAAICGVAQADDDGAAASKNSPRERKGAPEETSVNAGPLLHEYRKASTPEQLRAANAKAREHWDEFTAKQKKELADARKDASKRVKAEPQATAEPPLDDLFGYLIERFSRANDAVGFLEAAEEFERARDGLTLDERDVVLNAQEMARERIEAQSETPDAEPES